MEDREFKLEVLRVTLAQSTMAQMSDILTQAQKNLEWCLEEIGKPQAQSSRQQPRRDKR